MRAFLLFLGITFSYWINAQQLSYTSYNKLNELPTNEVYDLYIDRIGFLWIATDDGLLRYNGDNFKLYKNYDSKGNSFSYLQEDKYGRIWCSSFNGQIFYLENDSLKIFEPYDKLNSKNFPEILIDKNNNLIVTNRTNNLIKHNIFNKEKIELTKSRFLGVVSPIMLYDSTIYLTTVSLQKHKTPYALNSFDNAFLDSNNGFKCESTNFFRCSNNAVLKQSILYSNSSLANNEKLDIFFYQNKIINKRQLLNFDLKKLGQLQSVLLNNDSSAFLGTTIGFYKVKNIYDSLSNIECIIKDVNVSKILNDNYDNIWVATLTKGLLKISSNNVYSLEINLEKGNQEFTHLATNNQNIVVGVFGNKILYYDIDKNNYLTTNLTEFGKIQNLYYDEIRAKFVLCQNKAYELQIHKNGIKLIGLNYTTTNIKKILRTRNDNQIIIGGSLFNWNNAEQKLKMLEKQRGYDICIDKNNSNIWYASLDGLKVIDTNFRIHFLKDINIKNIYANKLINNTSFFYVSTFNNGVFIFKNNKIFKHLNTNNLLPSNYIKKIACTNEYLAIHYSNEIVILDSWGSQIIKTISIKAGLQSELINDFNFINDKLFIATNLGIQYFIITPSKHNIQPKVFIDKITIDGKKVATVDTLISLPYNIKKIVLSLNGLDLNSNSKFKYLYRLLPVDSQWKTVTNQDLLIEFENLNSGNYNLEYKLFNNNLNKKAIVNKYTFIVKLPYWKEWYFIAFIVALLIFLIIAIYKYNIKIINKKHKEALNKAILSDKLKQAQLAALKVQMNPHFIFNALNSIQDFILLNEKENANFYLGKFSKLMRMVLDMSNKNMITFKEELDLLKIYLELEALRFEKDFDYLITLYDKLDAYQADIEFPPLLIQPFIENSLKHGLLHKKGRRILKIDFTLENDFLICTIEDNGIGRKQSQEINAIRNKNYTSFATGATENRLQLINSLQANNINVTYTDKFDEEHLPMGTIVTLRIMINAVHK